MPTIQDVARDAGVSTATVSRVFSAPELVLEGTRQKVMEAVARLGYEPNFAAKSLRTLRTEKILVTHGTGFNWPEPDHFRLVTLPNVEVLTEAIGRIADYLAELRA